MQSEKQSRNGSELY